MRPIRILGPCLIALPLCAQMHHVDKAQRVTRAVGVYEWTGDMAKPDAARLIPVSIFINNHYEDAGVFLAQPIPLALETGNVYAVQHSGDPIGSLDLDFARNIVDKRSTADDDPLGAWYGYGRFIPLAAAPPPAKLTQHSATPAVVIGSDDDSRPHFVPSRHPNDSSSTTTPARGSAPDSTSTSASPAPADDPDRPHMNKRNSDSSTTDNAPVSSGTNSQGTAAQDTGTVPDDDPDRPTLGRRKADNGKKQKKEKESGSGVEAMPTSLNEDPDRPEIHRGKVESATAPPQLTGTPTNLHQAVAVSDTANNPTHVFNRDWETPIERASTMADMQKLAQPLVRQYLTANHLEPAPVSASGPKLNTAPSTAAAKTATHSTAHTATTHTATTHTATTHTATTHSTAAQHTASAPAAAPLTFTDEQISGYTLSYGGLPTFVYSAALVTTAGPPVRVTVIAQRLPAGGLQLSLSSVTDEGHLDRTPWMRLVDAVDPDDSHRASLLFELRGRNSRQFALYSLASAQAQQTFITGVIE
ncbi:MAG TPA: hypothetical protein VN734_08020 [Acidobacteriaceae bacterium]|nr:hypothetical protein [Acidobacteriaceae bacterium]